MNKLCFRQQLLAGRQYLEGNYVKKKVPELQILLDQVRCQRVNVKHMVEQRIEYIYNTYCIYILWYGI